MYESEKCGGNKVNNKLASSFLNCCRNIRVKNIRIEGPKFTWANRRKGRNKIKERLDRFLVNANWSNLFPNVLATNSSFYGSDHRVVKIKLNHQIWVRKERNSSKKFAFENKWKLEENFDKGVGSLLGAI